jgi:magnesium transporter
VAELTLEDLKAALNGGDEAGLGQLVGRVHPADMADLLERLDADERIRVFRLLPPEIASETLAELEGEERSGLLEGVDP